MDRSAAVIAMAAPLSGAPLCSAGASRDNLLANRWPDLQADARWMDPGVTNTVDELILGLRLIARLEEAYQETAA